MVSTIDVRQRIGDMLNRVALRHDEFVIERKGEPLAALVPIERLEQMRRFARARALLCLEQQKGRRSDRTPGRRIGTRGAKVGATPDAPDTPQDRSPAWVGIGMMTSTTQPPSRDERRSL